MERLAVFVIAVVSFTTLVNGKGACQKEYNRLDKIRQESIATNGMPPLGLHLPNCLKDGTYDAMQCVEAMCKCVKPGGEILVPFQDRATSRSMNCKCIRAKHDYGVTGMLGKIFRCDAIGNYETIQCTGSMCYCVDSNGKQQGARKKKYNRLDKIRISNDGIAPPGLHFPNCLADGTYGAMQCVKAMCKCVKPGGEILIPFQDRKTSGTMTCKCIRAKHDYGVTGMLGKIYRCDAIGNYETIQCTGSMCYCVDSNGKQQGDSVRASEQSSLNC